MTLRFRQYVRATNPRTLSVTYDSQLVNGKLQADLLLQSNAHFVLTVGKSSDAIRFEVPLQSNTEVQTSLKCSKFGTSLARTKVDIVKFSSTITFTYF